VYKNVTVLLCMNYRHMPAVPRSLLVESAAAAVRHRSALDLPSRLNITTEYMYDLQKWITITNVSKISLEIFLVLHKFQNSMLNELKANMEITVQACSM